MKENRFLILGIISMVAALAVLLFAFLMPTSQPETDPPEKRIAVLIPQSNTDYWEQVIYGIQEETNSTMSVQVTQISQTDVDEQQLRFEMAVAADVDGIIVQFSDDTVAEKMLEKADASGIPVVLMGSDVPENDRYCYVGSDHYQAGQMAAELLYESSGGRASIAIISGLENQNSQKQKIQGFRDALIQWPQMEVVCVEYSGMDSVQAAQTTQTLLKAYPEINVFVGITEEDLEGIIKTIEPKLNSDAYHLIGFDDSVGTISGIRRGIVTASIVEEPYEMGRQAVLQLVQIMDGEQEMAARQVETGLFVVKKDTLTDYDAWIQERRYE